MGGTIPRQVDLGCIRSLAEQKPDSKLVIRLPPGSCLEFPPSTSLSDRLSSRSVSWMEPPLPELLSVTVSIAATESKLDCKGTVLFFTKKQYFFFPVSLRPRVNNNYSQRVVFRIPQMFQKSFLRGTAWDKGMNWIFVDTLYTDYIFQCFPSIWVGGIYTYCCMASEECQHVGWVLFVCLFVSCFAF